jgi:hypothetical protein
MCPNSCLSCRYCLAAGTYNIHLNDDSLFVTYGKHALVVVTDIASGTSVTVTGSTTASFSVTTLAPTMAPTEYTKKNLNGNDDNDEMSGGAVAGIVIGVLVGVAIIGAIVWYVIALIVLMHGGGTITDYISWCYS